MNAQDANRAAIASAGLDPEYSSWLDEVAGQVEPRLDRVTGDWREQPHAEAAKSLAFGLLLGQLAQRYPQARADLSRVAEAHPSFTNLVAGSRLDTLAEISGDPQRMTAWIGPLLGESDPGQVTQMLDQ